jgi:7-carboxy-7-deazaguanine synthase
METSLPTMPISVLSEVAAKKVAKAYTVKEIFGPTMQGEFLMAGQMTLFLRMHFCDGDGLGHWCEWCDTRETWDRNYPGYALSRRMMAEEILTELLERTEKHSGQPNVAWMSGPRDKLRWCTISGGNPVMQLDDEIIRTLTPYYRLQIETQGTICKPCLRMCDMVVVSPKPPSSGLVSLTARQLDAWSDLTTYGVEVGMKIVVFDDKDFDWAVSLYQDARIHLSRKIKFGLQAGTAQDGDVTEVVLDKYRWLVTKWLQSGKMPDAVVLPQVHTLVWGRRKGV